MFMLRRKTWFIILTVVVLACLYDHVNGQGGRRIKNTDIAKALFQVSAAVQQNEILFTPIRIIFRLIEFVIGAVTWPFRFIYRLIFNFIAILALLMLNCRIIPRTVCPDRDVAAVVEEILSGIQQELEFFARMDVNAK